MLNIRATPGSVFPGSTMYVEYAGPNSRSFFSMAAFFPFWAGEVCTEVDIAIDGGGDEEELGSIILRKN